MKKQHQMLSIILVLFALNRKLLALNVYDIQSNITDNVIFFQGSNSKDLLSEGNVTAITYNVVDGSNGYVIFENGTFTYNTSGVYFGIFASQIGSPNKVGIGEVHIWVRRGTQDKPNSNSVQSVDRGSTSILIYQTIFLAPIGRDSTLVFSAHTTHKCTSMGLISTEPENEPVVSSIISSTIQLSDDINIIPYALLSSSETQLGNSTFAAVRINTFGGNTAIDTSTSASNGAIRYNTSGVYVIIASGQVGSDIGANATGDVHLWVRLNDVDLPNSNTFQTILNDNTAVLVSQTMIRLNANDEIKLIISSTNTSLGLIASTPINEPAAPSIVISTFQLRDEGNSAPYIQLSSLRSQWGCITPQVVQLDTIDISQHVTSNDSTIQFNVSGTYFMIAAAQVGTDGIGGVGDVHLWMRLNGQDIPNSNNIQTVNDDTTVLVCQTIIVIQIGDEVQLLFSTDVSTGTIGLVASQVENEPTVASIIFTAFRSSYSNGILVNHEQMNVGGD